MTTSDRQRFEALAMPHLEAVHRMALALTQCQTEADDLVQETFIRGYRAFGGFELREYGAKPWLLRILHNVFYSTRARQRRQPFGLASFDPDDLADEISTPFEPIPAASVDWEMFDQELRGAVMALPMEYREVLLLWALDGLTYREIAEVCQCPLGTIMSRLYRARSLLTRRLRGYARDRGLLGQRNRS